MSEQTRSVKITLVIETNEQTVHEQFATVEELWDWLAMSEWIDLLPNWDVDR